VNLLGVNIRRYNKETHETLFIAGKDVGLEVNAEKTLLSLHQNAEQNYDKAS
jgi:hypothetical protein